MLLRKAADIVLLDLHGAMVTQSLDDGEGELLRRIRAVDAEVPIGVALDFHTNLTPAMVENADVITGYRTYPHIDMYETGERCLKSVLRMLAGEARPRMMWGTLPIISATIRHSPSQEPMKTPMDMAIAAEASGQVLNASLFGGFPFADIPHVSLSSVVVHDGDPNVATELQTAMLSSAWQNRAGFRFQAEPLETTISKAKTLSEGPVVIGDYGDTSGAGGAMDDVSVVREMRRQELHDIAVSPIWDPEALAAMKSAGIGATLTLPIGGKTDAPSIGMRGRPLELSGQVKAITDGRFLIEGDMMAGFPVNLEGTAVFDTGDIEIIVSGARSEPYTPQYFTHAGIDPTRKRYVVVKSRQHFRAAFSPIARHILMAGGCGICRDEFEKIPYEKLQRPIYPLNPDLHLGFCYEIRTMNCSICVNPVGRNSPT